MEMGRRSAAARLLGVAPDASPPTVEAAFRGLAPRLHPDRGGDPAAFRRLVAARATLLDNPVTVARLVTPAVGVRRAQRRRDELRALLARRLGLHVPRVR